MLRSRAIVLMARAVACLAAALQAGTYAWFPFNFSDAGGLQIYFEIGFLTWAAITFLAVVFSLVPARSRFVRDQVVFLAHGLQVSSLGMGLICVYLDPERAHGYALMLGAVAGLVAIRFAIPPDRSPERACPVCDYDLSGLRGDLCPECGSKPDQRL